MSRSARTGRSLAAGDGTGEVSLWDVATGKRIASLAEGGPVADVAFSPDGQVLAVGDNQFIGPATGVTLDDQQGSVGLWKVATRQRVGRLVVGNQVNSVAFSPDGHALLTADNTDNVDVWNVATGQLFADLTQAGGVTNVVFAPHGQDVAIGGGNGQVTLLRQDLTNFSPQFYRRLICGEVRENLTQAQSAQFTPGQPYQKTCP